jgi:hypothetical protein
MPADLHNQIHRRSLQKFIGTEGAPRRISKGGPPTHLPST